MDPATLTLEQALELLQIPRVVGTDPETNEDVVAHNGRFGPYLKRGADTRSLGSEEQLLTVTLAGVTVVRGLKSASAAGATTSMNVKLACSSTDPCDWARMFCR